MPDGPVYLKDLTLLGRNLKRVIIVDNVAQNFRRQPENGIQIKSWFGDDMQDQALFELGPILRQIVDCEYDNVQQGLRDLIGAG